MKKIFAFALILCITLSAVVSVSAATGIIIDGRTMIPIRGVFEELGFYVEWNDGTAWITSPNDGPDKGKFLTIKKMMTFLNYMREKTNRYI